MQIFTNGTRERRTDKAQPETWSKSCCAGVGCSEEGQTGEEEANHQAVEASTRAGPSWSQLRGLSQAAGA